MPPFNIAWHMITARAAMDRMASGPTTARSSLCSITGSIIRVARVWAALAYIRNALTGSLINNIFYASGDLQLHQFYREQSGRHD
jgi:hypothetical protein